ncbi:MAG: replication protein, partial [Bdellovibrionota bacterium]
MKNKIELKTALDALQVGKPFKLNVSAPSFKAPPTLNAYATSVEFPTPVDSNTQVGFGTGVQVPTQVTEPTQVLNPTEGMNTTPALDSTSVENQPGIQKAAPVSVSTPVTIPTEVDSRTAVTKPTQISKTTPVENRPQAEIPTEVENKEGDDSQAETISHRAIEQDSSVVFEARTVDGLERGYTRLPNSILMRLTQGEFTRNEMKLVLLIARFTISYQRRQAPLSKTVLERRTGMRGASVLEALSGLIA